MDFFETTQKTLPFLNSTESTLFDYVVKNMEKVSHMSIQKLAAVHYLSTTTIFRFTQKLGFSGYSEFTNSLLITSHQNRFSSIPNVLHKNAYSEEYLKNAMESVRVLPVDKVSRVQGVLDSCPNVYIMTDSHTDDIGRYCEKLFLGLGLRTYFPETEYQMTALLDLIQDDDLLIALSYSGQNTTLVSNLERVFLEKHPFLLSITRADNNILQNMSDVNFYIFADEISLHGIDLTSCVSMLMILELIVYSQASVHG